MGMSCEVLWLLKQREDPQDAKHCAVIGELWVMPLPGGPQGSHDGASGAGVSVAKEGR